MKVSELREKLKDRKKDELQHLVVEMYKQFPKKMREAKEIDQLVDDASAFKTKKKSGNKVINNIDFDSVKVETENFIKDARAQYYFAPNRLISKKERSNWRFTAKRIVEQVTGFCNQPEHAKAGVSLLEELYKLFCYAACHYVFTSQEPFHTLKIPQEDFYKRVVLLKKQVEEPGVWIRDSLLLILENEIDYDTLKSSLSQVLLDTLNNAPLKEKAIRIGEDILGEKKANAKKVLRAEGKSISIRGEDCINDLVEMIFMTQSSLGEFKVANKFFNQHYVSLNKEIKLYVLLGLIMHNQRVDDWMEEYESAVQKGINPRKALEKATEYIREKSEFPEYISSF